MWTLPNTLLNGVPIAGWLEEGNSIMFSHVTTEYRPSECYPQYYTEYYTCILVTWAFLNSQLSGKYYTTFSLYSTRCYI